MLWLPDVLRGRRAAAVAVEVPGLRRLCGLRGGSRAGGAPACRSSVRGGRGAARAPRAAPRSRRPAWEPRWCGPGRDARRSTRCGSGRFSRIKSVRAGRCRRPESGSANSRSRCCERPAADVRRCRARSAAAARSTACRDLVVIEGNLLCDETRGPGPGLPAGQCPAARVAESLQVTHIKRLADNWPTSIPPFATTFRAGIQRTIRALRGPVRLVVCLLPAAVQRRQRVEKSAAGVLPGAPWPLAFTRSPIVVAVHAALVRAVSSRNAVGVITSERRAVAIRPATPTACRRRACHRRTPASGLAVRWSRFFGPPAKGRRKNNFLEVPVVSL